LDCLYIILYFFFGHWIVCTLFCAFSFAIGLPVLYFVLCTYSFGHYCVVSSSIYGFSLPLWYLQTLLNNMIVVSYYFYQGCH
jgi:hypothetical protein